MDIVNLGPQHLEAYCACLEEYSDEIKEGADHKKRWYEEMKDKGLRVKLALVDGKPYGMIHYVPIEHAFAEGRGHYFVHCIWVHAHKGKGVGDQRKRGLGKALLRAAEDDARALGAKGLAVWGMAIPVFMRASWFRKQGYRKADRIGVQVLLWKPFADDAVPPRWIREKKRPDKLEGRVAVDAFVHGWCPAMNMTFARAKRACAELGGAVAFRPVWTLDRAAFEEWGIADGVYIDGKPVRTGPPPTYEKLRRKIGTRIRKRGLHR
jgi:GNAT superfamily N-acetyltransferase